MNNNLKDNKNWMKGSSLKWEEKIDIDVGNIQIPYEIFIYVEGGISDPNLEAG